MLNLDVISILIYFDHLIRFLNSFLLTALLVAGGELVGKGGLRWLFSAPYGKSSFLDFYAHSPFPWVWFLRIVGETTFYAFCQVDFLYLTFYGGRRIGAVPYATPK